jgi:predicted nucleic acid-binding protein
MARLRGRVGGTLVLDAEGLVKLAAGQQAAYARVKAARDRRSTIVTAASTLSQVLRGGPRDARMHRVLSRITVIPIDKETGRAAGELLGRTRLSGQHCTLDALLAVIALGQPRPVVLLTSDTDDMSQLTEEPGRHNTQRIRVIRV